MVDRSTCGFPRWHHILTGTVGLLESLGPGLVFICLTDIHLVFVHSQHVLFEGLVNAEFLGAPAANVWPLSSVNTHVLFQLPTATKHLVAMHTAVLFGRLIFRERRRAVVVRGRSAFLLINHLFFARGRRGFFITGLRFRRVCGLSFFLQQFLEFTAKWFMIPKSTWKRELLFATFALLV